MWSKFNLLQLKVVELTDALESSGSYSKAEISERVSKFRDKLMQVRMISFTSTFEIIFQTESTMILISCVHLIL